MLLGFARARAAAHADILNRAAKAGHFMPFKMRKANKDIGVHNRAANLGLGYIFAALYRNRNVIGSLQAVAN